MEGLLGAGRKAIMIAHEKVTLGWIKNERDMGHLLGYSSLIFIFKNKFKIEVSKRWICNFMMRKENYLGEEPLL